MKSKIFFRSIFLICLLTVLSFNNGFSRCKADEFISSIDSLPLVEEVSKLTETKKGVKRSYQSSSDSIPSDPTPVEIKLLSTVNTSTKMMDVETVNAFKAALSDVNNSQNESQEASAISLIRISTNLEILIEMFDKSYELEVNKHQELLKKQRRKAIAYCVWPFLFILSAAAYVYCTYTDRPEARYVALVVVVISLLATGGLISNATFLFS